MEENERNKSEKENKENGNIVVIIDRINLNEDYLYDVIN